MAVQVPYNPELLTPFDSDVFALALLDQVIPWSKLLCWIFIFWLVYLRLHQDEVQVFVQLKYFTSSAKFPPSSSLRFNAVAEWWDEYIA